MQGQTSTKHRSEDAGRSFSVVTYGCQMNVHDSEKLSNLLHHSGLSEASGADDADLLIINTCSIRDKAENQLYSDLGRLGRWKEGRPGRVLGVGGCVAQQVGDGLLRRFPQLDFVFGTHNIRHVPSMVEAALAGSRSARLEETSSMERFDLPERHPDYAGSSNGKAFVTVMEGCDMFCSFCIVPMTRGREISRRADDIVAEARQLADRGVCEITLLGQTVNAYGRHDVRRGNSDRAGTLAFAQLLRQLDAIPGLERIRYTSPHPIFFDDALIAAHGELEHLCPHVHLPLQSGSDRVLEQMRRRYTAAEYLALCRKLRASRPDVAITSDIIVAFPSETDSEFGETLAVVAEALLVDSFSFKYSPRPGTKAPEQGAAIPPDEAQDRLVRLQKLQRGQTLEYHRSRVGATTQILLHGESRRGGGQVCGRDPFHRVVNVDATEFEVGAGDWLDVEIVEATPHSLIGEVAAEDRAGNSPGSVRRKPRSAEELLQSAASRGEVSSPREDDPLRVI